MMKAASRKRAHRLWSCSAALLNNAPDIIAGPQIRDNDYCLKRQLAFLLTQPEIRPATVSDLPPRLANTYCGDS
jgi:hypothetical protein